MLPANHSHYLEELHAPVAFAATIDAVLKPESRSEHIALWISQVGSPPVMGLLALLLTAASTAYPGVWRWVALYLVGGLLLPIAFLIWQVRNGHITDLDVQLREQRKAAFLITILGFSATWLVMLVGHAPPLLTLMAGAGVLQWIIIYAITLRWKISVHSASAAGATMLLLYIYGHTAAPLVITLPLIAWSRVKLRRHTPAQTIAGSALGIIVVLIALILTSTGP